MRIRYLIPAGLAGLALAVAGLTAAAASASTPSVGTVYTETTHLTQRPDSGGNGNWALDNFTRTAHVTFRGAVALSFCGTLTGHCYAFTGGLADKGSFKTIPGAFAPNQGQFPGSVIGTEAETGTFNGFGSFMPRFYATALPNPELVPDNVTGSSDPSSTWPELFFPPGTVKAAPSETNFGYFYATGDSPVQKWADTASNGSGQNTGDGNITE